MGLSWLRTLITSKTIVQGHLHRQPPPRHHQQRSLVPSHLSAFGYTGGVPSHRRRSLAPATFPPMFPPGDVPSHVSSHVSAFGAMAFGPARWSLSLVVVVVGRVVAVFVVDCRSRRTNVVCRVSFETDERRWGRSVGSVGVGVASVS
ncbi:hypothetical protein K523DRAFT_326419 [Schizophyllum commune Tattone D]|nr:hypothetical protein K523DRAFT_326419 [Schizophyllum commune Tattone D]